MTLIRAITQTILEIDTEAYVSAASDAGALPEGLTSEDYEGIAYDTAKHYDPKDLLPDWTQDAVRITGYGVTTEVIS